MNQVQLKIKLHTFIYTLYYKSESSLFYDHSVQTHNEKVLNNWHRLKWLQKQTPRYNVNTIYLGIYKTMSIDIDFHNENKFCLSLYETTGFCNFFYRY